MKPTMSIPDAVKHVMLQLTAEMHNYARSKERGVDRGFPALHDKCDANMLLPHVGDYNAADQEMADWMNAVTDAVTVALVHSRNRWILERDTFLIVYGTYMNGRNKTKLIKRTSALATSLEDYFETDGLTEIRVIGSIKIEGDDYMLTDCYTED